MAVRAIYLTPADREAFDKAQSKAWGSTLYCFQYSGHDLRTGERSRVFSTHGVGISVPKRVP